MMRRLLLLALALPLPSSALELGLPVACTPGTDCWVIHYVDHDPGPGTADSFCGPMTYDGHDGIDFGIRDGAAMRAGVDVVASAAGKVRAIRDSVPDVTVEQGGRQAVAGIDCGNGVVVQHGDGWETQYCHLRRGSILVQPGQEVAAGQKLGLVGLSGMTSFPHLHLAVRKDGVELDPFHGDAVAQACGGDGQPLWNPQALEDIGAYQALAMPILGITDRPADAAEVWDGRAEPGELTTASPALVVFMGAYSLRKDDRIRLTLTGPDSASTVDHEDIQERNQARTMRFAGKKRAAEWLAGGRMDRQRRCHPGRQDLHAVPFLPGRRRA